jgi:uncharacterized protein YcaQ
MNIYEYWQGVNKLHDSLPPGDHLTVISVDYREKGITAGHVCIVERKDAARLIFDRTHRLAEPEEIDSDQRKQEERRAEAAKTENERRGNPILPDGLLENLIRLAEQGAQGAPSAGVANEKRRKPE